MKTLYLVRHGVAVPFGTPDIEDDARELTKRGERKLHEIGKGLRRMRIKLDAIITSPLPRAHKTAEILADELGMTSALRIDDALRADQTAITIRQWLLTCPEEHIMLVGHNPSLSALVGVLLGAGKSNLHIELRKGGIAAFSCRESDRYQLDWLARPRLIRA